MNHTRATFGIKWGRLWGLAAPGVARAFWIVLRVLVIGAFAAASLTLLVPHVPPEFWYLATGILSVIAWAPITWITGWLWCSAYGWDRDPYPYYMWRRFAMATIPFLMATAITGAMWGFGGVVDSSYVVGAVAIAGIAAMPFFLSALWALLGGGLGQDD